MLGFKLGFKMHVFLSRRPQGSSFPGSRKSNKTTHRVMTCITAACMHVIDQLLKVRADQESKKKDSATALHLQACSSSVPKVKASQSAVAGLSLETAHKSVPFSQMTSH